MKHLQLIGLMSGTSLDGLDIACCTFWKTENAWHFRLDCAESLAYTPDMQQKLKTSIHLSGLDLLLFHNAYGTWLGEQVRTFVEKHQLAPDAVASHGHTVFHQTDKRLTFQLGAGYSLAAAAKLPVIADFRSADVALGGQGAPLVPIGDAHLFGAYDFCLNLGGIANVSFQQQGLRVAYDICPINMLLNHLIAPLGLPYDAGGQRARSGTLNKNLLDALNRLPFYTQPFPKSLGYEWFVEAVLPLVKTHTDHTENLLHTAVVHAAQQIAAAILPHASPAKVFQLLATGGGAYNTFFIEQLQEALGERVRVVVPSPEIIEFKEAIVFAFMGALHLVGEKTCLKSVTGATQDTSSGVYYAF